MATGHFVKRSGDVGAPVLSNSAGSLIAVLDWALDVATGTHWEKVFTGTNKAAYRATTGERCYLRVDDTIGQVARFIAYRSMTDVDTGVDPFPGPVTTYGYLGAPKSDTTSSDYTIVGDSRGFLVVTVFDPSYPFINVAWWFGEITPFDGTDGFTTMLAAGMNNITTAAYNQWTAHGVFEDISVPGAASTQLPNSTAFYMVGDPTGAVKGVGANALTVGGSHNSSNYKTPLANAGLVVTLPIYIFSATGQESGDNINGRFRGVFPYLYSTNIEAGNGFSNRDTFVDGSEEFEIALSGSSTTISTNNSAAYVIRISNTEPGRI